MQIVMNDSRIRQFVQISGDDNPIHTDAEVARNSIFAGRVAHGMLTAVFMDSFAQSSLQENFQLTPIKIVFSEPVRLDQEVHFEMGDVFSVGKNNFVEVAAYKWIYFEGDVRKKQILATTRYEVLEKNNHESTDSENKLNKQSRGVDSSTHFHEKIKISTKQINDLESLVKDVQKNNITISKTTSGKVPRIFIGALFSKVLNDGLGPGGIYINQTFNFIKDLNLSEEYEFVIAKIKRRSNGENGDLGFIDLEVRNSRGEEVVSGKSLVQFPKNW